MICAAFNTLRGELDQNLTAEVAGLTNQPITTETLARYIHQRTSESLAVDRVRLHERSDFFAEYWERRNDSSSASRRPSVPRIA